MRTRTPFALLLVSCVLIPAAASAQAPAGRALLDTERGVLSYANQIAPALSAVVRIAVTSEGPRRRTSPDPQIEKLLEGVPPNIATSEASGFVIDATAGLIVTAGLQLEDTTSVRVLLHDGRQVAAIVVGLDRESAVGLLRVEATGLTALRWADSTAARIGDVAFAAGSTPSIGTIVNSGIVSGFSRYIQALNYLETVVSDVSLPVGVHGGPLLDSQGQVLGILTGTFGSRNAAPIACALSSKEAQRIVSELRAGQAPGQKH